MKRSGMCLLLCLLPLAAAKPLAAADLVTTSQFIGTAQIDAEGNIVLHLRASGNGMVGHSVMSYAPSAPDYDEILNHVGPLKPGEIKPLRPWPDPPQK